MNHKANTEVKKISIDKELVAKVDSLLHSELEGKVPYGAWQAYVTRLIREDFRRREVSSEVLEDLKLDVYSVRGISQEAQLTASRAFAFRRATDYLSKQMNIEDQLLYQHIEDFLGGKL